MSRFYSFYELLNFWTLNYELGDDLHKTRWQGANIKATHCSSACVHLDSLNLSAWSFLFKRVFTAVCVYVCKCSSFHCVFICLFARETMRMHTWPSESVCLVDRVFTSLELVHYSLTVLPSEIPGSGCVRQTHTKHIHTQTKENAHIHFHFKNEYTSFAILFCTE